MNTFKVRGSKPKAKSYLSAPKNEVRADQAYFHWLSHLNTHNYVVDKFKIRRSKGLVREFDKHGVV